MKWIGDFDGTLEDLITSLPALTSFGSAGATTNTAGDVTFYQPVNDADPRISIGSSDDERLSITINYAGTTTQTAQIASFKTFTESATAHDGRFHFTVDEDEILKIQDGGIDLFAGKGIGINGVDILTDNGSGTATLSNIDALDATTEATIEAAIDTINAGENTTTAGLTIDANALTTGSALHLDVDDGLTTSATKSLLIVDYDKAGVTDGEQISATTGLDINMADAATNHEEGVVTMIGAQIDVDSANEQGIITQKGLVLNVAADGVGDVATTSGIEMEVADGGTDIKMMSHADTADYCTIATTTNGATTLTTVDGGAHGADLTFNIDGFTKFTSPDTTGGGVEIENASASGVPALLIDNNDVDKHALKLEAANTTSNTFQIAVPNQTTGNVIKINADSLTTGSAIDLDIDDALTTSATKSLIEVDYDKGGITASGQTSDTTGLKISMEDSVTNVGTVNQTGISVDLDFDNAGGTLVQKGLVLGVGADDVGDAAAAVGIEMEVIDGGTDIKMMSSADTADYCSIATTTHGATTITTVDSDLSGDDAVAHFEIAADGDIILDANGQIKLEPIAGNNILLDGTVTVDGGSVTGITTLGVDSVSLTAVQTSGESFVDNDTSIMTSAAINDKIDTKYSHSIISFTGQATMESSGNWVMPGKPGIGSHTWNNDMGVNTETNGTSEASIDRRWAHAGVRVPFACVVDGISCTISNAGGNRQVTVGLFFARAADGTTAVTWGADTGNVSAEPILQIHADANNESGTYSSRPSHAEATGSDIAMAAGDVFYPAIKLTGVTSGGNTDNVYASFNVHIKTLIS